MTMGDTLMASITDPGTLGPLAVRAHAGNTTPIELYPLLLWNKVMKAEGDASHAVQIGKGG